MNRVKQWMRGALRGFTLVELLVVVIIIGILAAIGIPQYTKTIEKARGAEGRSGLGHIQQGEKLYHTEYEEYARCATGTDEINQDLDVHITEKFWTFEVTSGDGGTPNNTEHQGFLAKATRRSGRCASATLYMDYCGNFAEKTTDTFCLVDEACDSCTGGFVAPEEGWGTCVDNI